MRSENGSHEFGSFPFKKEIVAPFPSMFCILVLQQKLGPKSLSFQNINIGSNLYLNLTCNPHILGRAGIIATPRLVVTAARCLVSAWCSVVSSASCRFGVFNTLYRFSLSPLSLFTFTFTFFDLVSLSHFHSEANLLTLGYSHRSRHLRLVMEEKRLPQPEVNH